MPRWTLAAAFAAGLLPGLLLYWNARPAPTPSTATVRPAPPAPIAAPPPATTSPAKPVDEHKRATTPGKPDRPEADPRLSAEHQEALAKLAATERSLADAQTKLHDLEARLTSLQDQQQRAQTQEREWQEQLTNWQRQAATAEAAAKAREARVLELEAAQQRLQRQGSDVNQRLQRMGELSVELEEIARRREVYLNSIIGRYREATDLFRAISLRLDNPRDAGSPLNNDLSRIQAAIQHADEDLRQLRALNVQSARVQKELGVRR